MKFMISIAWFNHEKVFKVIKSMSKVFVTLCFGNTLYIHSQLMLTKMLQLVIASISILWEDT